MPDAGYSGQDVDSIRTEVAHFEKVRDEVKLASGDLVEMKRFEPAMRHLLDMYIRADDSEVLMDFEELGLIELIVEKALMPWRLCLKVFVRIRKPWPKPSKITCVKPSLMKTRLTLSITSKCRCYWMS